MKVCIEPDCWEATPNTRCPAHEAEFQRARNQRRGKARTRHAPYRGTSLAGRVCACCGVGSDLTRHHVVPLDGPARALPAWSGGYALVAMCRPCNSSIGARFMLTRECPMHGGTPGGA